MPRSWREFPAAGGAPRNVEQKTVRFPIDTRSRHSGMAAIRSGLGRTSWIAMRRCSSSMADYRTVDSRAARGSPGSALARLESRFCY